jgi:hypothetical protein
VEFIFKDEAFKFETLRAAGFAGDAGADIGEVIATTSQIAEGDEQGSKGRPRRWHDNCRHRTSMS